MAAAGAILSLPAFFAAYAGSALVYMTALLGGYDGTPLQAVLKLLGSWNGRMIMALVLMAIVHIAVFLYLLARFARGLTLPVAAQLYCLAIVLLAIGERIRLSIINGNAFFWFGAFSVPHPLCLFAIVWLNAHSRGPKRSGAAADSA